MKKVLTTISKKKLRLREVNVMIKRDFWDMNCRITFSFDVNVATF